MTATELSPINPQRGERSAPDLLSIVVPCYNEEENISHLRERIETVMRNLGQPYELVFVNDGSTDRTLVGLLRLRDRQEQITVVNLTRNFGKEIALTAGLAHAVGDAVVIIDCDLQDPPELIADFITQYRKGYDVVCGRRVERYSDTVFKRVTAAAFYRLMRNLGPVRLPENVGDFRLMSRRALDDLLRLPENHRFMKGLFAWIGYPTVMVDYAREARYAGATKWNVRQLTNLSIEGITSFTTLPLRLTTYLGFLLAFSAFVGGAVYLFRRVLYGDEVQGFATLLLTILLLGGSQLIALGVIGEYLGRVFNETKRRPLFLVEGVAWSEPATQRRTESAMSIGSSNETSDARSVGGAGQ